MATLKHHHMKFKKGPGDGGVAEWVSLIMEVSGVIRVNIDAAKKDVYIEYDLEKCSEEAIEHWMNKAGFVLDDSFLGRVKRGFIHFTEENAREALSEKPRSFREVKDIEKKGKTP
ncbi:MAG: hypothetical protein IME96_08510 [Proteobacteria bacterium]|nr:hypothetical protein [Pseudomonadota bacterium]